MQTMVRRLINSKFANGMMSLPRKIPGELIDLYLIRAMEKANLYPEVVYAFKQTLLWITDSNIRDYLGRPNFTEAELAAWDAAQEDYRKANRE